MKIYNTLTRRKEELSPLDPPQVRLYSCGPTVYSFAHIGNMRTYIFMDILRRTLELNGYKPLHVMNITDVGHLTDDADAGEDKMLKGAREQKKTPWEIAAFYTDAFLKDIDALNIERPEIIPKATDHIPEMIEFVEGLVKNGYAYKTRDGIYFDIGKFPGYGKLSRLSLEDQMSGARVEVNPEKRHPADFALWKKAPKNHIMQWPSPWGMGYPGWHIECSAMSRKYLGDRFDIHTGGVDHIPVHHENEIAQSEGLLGHPAVTCWMHGEFMLVDGGKMSKSLRNVYTLSDLEKRGFSPLHFRYFCLNAHYRSKLNFTWEGMQASKTAYDRLLAGVFAHRGASGSADRDALGGLFNQFDESVNDDLNIPRALGTVWNMMHLPDKSDEVYQTIQKCDRVLGLGLDREPAEPEEETLEPELMALVEERTQAKKSRDFALADRLRAQLAEKGIRLEDTPQGVKWHRM